MSETTSADGSMHTRASTDTEGRTADSSAVAQGGEDGSPVEVVATSVVTDSGAVSQASTAVGDESQSDTVVTPASPSAPPRETPGAPGSENDYDLESLGVCEGLPKFLCCDDKDFYEQDGETFCGCLGNGVDQGCQFSVIKQDNPLVIKDVLFDGSVCRCQEAEEFTDEECFGRAKISCCDEIAPGATKCRCLFGDRCIYESAGQGKWRNTFIPGADCVCPSSQDG